LHRFTDAHLLGSARPAEIPPPESENPAFSRSLSKPRGQSSDLINILLSSRFGIPVSSSGSHADNRRRHGRILCDVASCELGDMVNVSASGMAVRTRKPLADGSDVAFWIEGPDGRFTVNAKVIRCIKTGWFRHELALQFVSLSDEARKGLTTMARLAATQQEIL